jgi:dUTP pyrophosphatase
MISQKNINDVASNFKRDNLEQEPYLSEFLGKGFSFLKRDFNLSDQVLGEIYDMVQIVYQAQKQALNPPIKLRWSGSGKLERGRAEDAGYDIYAFEDSVIRPGETKKIKTEVYLEIPPGYYGKISDRSSMGVKGLGIHGGVIDSSYRGECLVCLCNNNQGGDEQAYQITKGDKITQIIIQPYIKPELDHVNTLDSTDRGQNGFGSTGK